MSNAATRPDVGPVLLQPTAGTPRRARSQERPMPSAMRSSHSARTCNSVGLHRHGTYVGQTTHAEYSGGRWRVPSCFLPRKLLLLITIARGPGCMAGRCGDEAARSAAAAWSAREKKPQRMLRLTSCPPGGAGGMDGRAYICSVSIRLLIGEKVQLGRKKGTVGSLVLRLRCSRCGVRRRCRARKPNMPGCIEDAALEPGCRL